MKLNLIKASGIKGQEFAHDLGPATLFVGQNFCGKSSRLSAVRLLLYGVIPDPSTKQTEREMFALLASGRSMRVHGQFDSGLDIERRWTQDERGSVTASVSDGAPTFPETMLDPRQYLRLSDAKRTEYVFSLLDVGDSAGAAEKTVREALAGLDADTSEERIAKETLIGKVPPFTGKVNAWLDRISQILTEGKSENAAVSKRMSGMIQSLTQLEQQAQAPSRGAAEIEKERVLLQGRIENGNKIDGEAYSKIEGLTLAKDDVRRRVGEQNRLCDELTNEIGKRKAEITRLGKIRKCPTCGHAGTKWRDDLIGEEQKAVEELEAKVKAANELGASLAIEHETKVKEIQAVHAERVKYSTALRTLKERRTALTEEARAAGGKANDQTRTLQAQEQRGLADAALSVLKRAEKSIREIKERVMAGAFAHLIDRANSLAEGILLSPLVFRDNVIGRMKGQQFIPHGALSWTSAEQTVGYAAIGMALSESSPFKLLCLDDLQDLDTANMQKLMLRVTELIKSDTIDQFIGADVTVAKYSGIDTIEL